MAHPSYRPYQYVAVFHLHRQAGLLGLEYNQGGGLTAFFPVPAHVMALDGLSMVLDRLA